MKSSEKFNKWKQIVPMTRGDKLARLDYYPEAKKSGAKNPSEKRLLWQKSFEDIVGTLRSERVGWALSLAVVNPSSKASGDFVQRLLSGGFLRPFDKLALVVTEMFGMDARIDEELRREEPTLRTPPRVMSWFQQGPRKSLMHESFDVVFVAAENDSDLEAGSAISSDSSLIVANSDGARFIDYAASESDRERPAFCFSASMDHLQPLVTDGTRESAEEYIDLLSACQRSTGGTCVEERCPARFVAELIFREID